MKLHLVCVLVFGAWLGVVLADAEIKWYRQVMLIAGYILIVGMAYLAGREGEKK